MNFYSSLSYVLVGGKVQSSQKYIVNKMLPYANIDYRTKRNQITKEQKAVLVGKDRDSSPDVSIYDSEKMLMSKSQKKFRRFDMKVSNNTSIMEEDVETDEEVPLHKDASWTDLYSENQQLKTELQNQIALFE